MINYSHFTQYARAYRISGIKTRVLFVSCVASAKCHVPASFAGTQSAAPAPLNSRQAVIEAPRIGAGDMGGFEDNQVRSSPCGLFTPEIEKKYVHRVYDAIAPHFSATRFAKWPRVAHFLKSLEPGSVVVDVGCGNGKYLGLNPDCLFVGCDISAPLVSICSRRGHEVLVADGLHLPYRTGFCDAAISIAVLHHLSTEQRRKRAISELVRVVAPGGKVLITVWAREQEDPALVSKWTPLTTKYMEEWVKGTERIKRSSSGSSLGSIKEFERMMDDEQNFKIDEELEEGAEPELEPEPEVQVAMDDMNLNLKDPIPRKPQKVSGQQTAQETATEAQADSVDDQREFFVPWHLPYHRAEIGGASAAAVASGFARKDDKKGAVVYDRYYHVFVEGELEK